MGFGLSWVVLTVAITRTVGERKQFKAIVCSGAAASIWLWLVDRRGEEGSKDHRKIKRKKKAISEKDHKRVRLKLNWSNIKTIISICLYLLVIMHMQMHVAMTKTFRYMIKFGKKGLSYYTLLMKFFNICFILHSQYK